MRHARQAVENLQAALNWLRQNTRAEQIALIGHSMGAAASLVVAAHEQQNPPNANLPRLAGVVSICMGLEPSRGFMEAIGRAMLTQRSDYVAGAPAVQLLTEIESLVPSAQHIGNLPALFIAARQDVLIPVARVEGLARLAGPSAQVAVIDASHLEAPDRARATISQWLESGH